MFNSSNLTVSYIQFSVDMNVHLSKLLGKPPWNVFAAKHSLVVNTHSQGHHTVRLWSVVLKRTGIAIVHSNWSTIYFFTDFAERSCLTSSHDLVYARVKWNHYTPTFDEWAETNIQIMTLFLFLGVGKVYYEWVWQEGGIDNMRQLEYPLNIIQTGKS